MKLGLELPAGRVPDHPLTFRPQPMERIWGGSKLKELFGKNFPTDRPIGESWEIADRPGAASEITNGSFAGSTLPQLMHAFPEAMVGGFGRSDGRFPWLAKLLDAQDNLSLQVHPPTRLAAVMGGEPKSEIWYVAAAQPGASVLAGLHPGVTRDEFEARSRNGGVMGCCQSLPVIAGDVLFVPSGRVHALGAGIVIFELQQNSDTTYRVDDFGRKGLDGQPRKLHLAESLRAIDFSDFSPALVPHRPNGICPGIRRTLIQDPVFEATEIHGDHTHPISDLRLPASPGILAVVSGELKATGGGESVVLTAGGFCLLPARLARAELKCARPTVVLQLTVGTAPSKPI